MKSTFVPLGAAGWEWLDLASHTGEELREVAGIYEVNFEFMPELGERHGYPATLAGMGLVTLCITPVVPQEGVVVAEKRLLQLTHKGRALSMHGATGAGQGFVQLKHASRPQSQETPEF